MVLKMLTDIFAQTFKISDFFQNLEEYIIDQFYLRQWNH